MTYKTLSSKTAAALDKELMSNNGGGYTLEQLMELAGLSVAQSIYKEYPPAKFPNVLVIAGSGNNGGDGLVASRHLKMFGYSPIVYYPKQNEKNDFFKQLTTQLTNFQIELITKVLDMKELQDTIGKNQIIVDSMFGFSFKPPIRDPYGEIVKALIQVQGSSTDKKIVSVDIPTGWDVDEGPIDSPYLKPDLLVSLTAPKPCSEHSTGEFIHYLGGRFVSEQVASKWGFDIPKFPGVDQVVKLEL